MKKRRGRDCNPGGVVVVDKDEDLDVEELTAKIGNMGSLTKIVAAVLDVGEKPST